MFRKTFIAVMAVAAASIRLSAWVECGQNAPDFTLGSVSEERHSLSEYRGSYVVLEWFNHNCPFVHKFYDAGKMQEWQEEMTGRGVVWLTIDSTAPDHRDYMDAAEAAVVYRDMDMHPTELLLDPEGKVGKAYGATNTPQVFIIDPNGTLIYQGAVDDRRSSDPDDIEPARNYLLEALNNALSGAKVSENTTRPYGCSVKYARDSTSMVSY